jgi:hypothetical protein
VFNGHSPIRGELVLNVVGEKKTDRPITLMNDSGIVCVWCKDTTAKNVC